MKDFIKGVLIFICFLAVTVGIAYLGATVQKERNEKIYNNGVCINCGGHYEFVSVAKTKGISTSTYYYYKCDSCEKIIELQH